jgi:acetolactate synthase I/II/III large subunit
MASDNPATVTLTTDQPLTETSARQLTGGEAVVEMLHLHGVDHAFGMGGFQPLPYYDALARQNSIRHVLIRDEKHGAFAADAFARVTNRPAVADATLGPGATNLVSGAAESFGASVPVIFLTGDVNRSIAGRAATQESDQVGMLRPTMKQVVFIDRIERIPELVRRAFAIATGGRPGPVLIDMPEDVFHGIHDFTTADLYADDATRAIASRRIRPDQATLERAVELLGQAQRPTAILGGGIHLSAAYGQVQRLVDETGMPAACTISGKGALTDDHPLALGLCGRFSTIANEFVRDADLLLIVGCKLGEISTDRWKLIPPTTTVIQIDIDPLELGKVYKTAVGLWGDAALTLDELVDALGERSTLPLPGSRARAEHVERARQAWQLEARASYLSSERPTHVARLLHELRRALPAESIVVADGGFAAHWSALLLDIPVAGRHYIANRGHAAIGYGLPGALGAQLAAPHLPVVALCGDNGFAMALAELETAKREGLPITVIVVDNAALGYVKALQHGLYDGRFISADFLEIDYADVARSLGCWGKRVEEPGDLAAALAEAVETDLPAVVDVVTTRDASKMLPGVDSRTRSA